MKPNTKAILLSFVVFAAVFLVVRFVLTLGFNLKHSLVIGGISAAVASVLSPRRVVTYKQSGKEIRLKWFFSKKVIRFS